MMSQEWVDNMIKVIEYHAAQMRALAMQDRAGCDEYDTHYQAHKEALALLGGLADER